MCSPRFKAMTDQIMASHRKRMEASSSDQTSGEFKTYLPTTPENSIPIQAKTKHAATHSTTVATIVSSHEAYLPKGPLKGVSFMKAGELTLTCPYISQVRTKPHHQTWLSSQSRSQLVLISHGKDLDWCH